MGFKELLILAVTILSSECQFATKVTNIDFLGSGYDVFIGNPHSDLFDPGFRGEVLELSYTEVWNLVTSVKSEQKLVLMN